MALVFNKAPIPLHHIKPDRILVPASYVKNHFMRAHRKCFMLSLCAAQHLILDI